MPGFNLGVARFGTTDGGVSPIVYDFTTGHVAPDSFARASTAWDLDLTPYAVDQPRMKVGVGLLLEREATNIVSDSGAFALDPLAWGGAWIRDPVRPTAPDGTATAVELIWPNLNVVLRNEQYGSAVYTPGGPFAFSVYLQSDDLPGGFPVLVRNDTTAQQVAYGEFSTPIVASDSGVFTLRPGPGSWWRLTGLVSTGFEVGDRLGLYLGSLGSNHGGVRIRLWGLTITPGEVVGSPIMTPPSAGATRAAESAALTVPPGYTRWTAAYGATGEASGPLSGPVFDLTAAGRPWIGLGHELRWLRMH